MKSSKILKIIRFVNYVSPFPAISMYLGPVIFFSFFFTMSLMTKETRKGNDSNGHLLYLTISSEFSVIRCVHVSIHTLVDDCD